MYCKFQRSCAAFRNGSEKKIRAILGRFNDILLYKVPLRDGIDIPGASQVEKGEYSFSNDSICVRAVPNEHKKMSGIVTKNELLLFATAVCFVYLV